MMFVKLTKGKWAIVDNEDYDRCMKHSWCFHNKGYASSRINYKLVLLHNFIKPPPKGLLNDHIDRDGLNNQKSNLRFVTHSQNLMNSGKPKNNTTGYKGVSYHKKNNKFVAHLRVVGHQAYLGSFQTAVEAAKAYDNAVIEVFGSLAGLNFPKQ